ncbi:MAG: glycine zipper 2TM domain-containing protein [Rhodocyclales bacterium]|nr:glycine zipper 2TM domain-containing protein [Rhodocyclales bacterium]
METTTPTSSSASLHPVLWIAGISVTLLSLAGIAALTGLLPVKTAPAPERPAIVAAAPAPEPAAVAPAAPAAPAAPVAAPEVPAAAAAKAAPVSHQKIAKRKVAEEIPGGRPSAPPYPVAGGVPPDYVPPSVAATAPPAPPPCLDCGVIANVRQVTNEGKPSGAGAVIGGLAGAALGSNIGRGNTRTVASIAGAVGGGLLGNTIEKSQRQTTSYEVTLRMEDGSTHMIVSDAMPSWRIGDKVKLVSGAIVSR